MHGCPHQKTPVKCTCTYACAHHGKCCECVEYHRGSGEVPGCFFSTTAEASGDRSIEALRRDRSS